MAPWLTIDGDAYPAVVDGRIQWIVDAYTTSNGYPYASRTTLGDTTADSLTASNNNRAVVAQQNQVNYIRNSVKATVDAYTGQVKLYQWDTKDPVLKTWMKAFPGTVKPKADISSALMAHLRYPQDLFKVQRELLTRYHVTDAQTFLSGSEVWQVPDDPTNKSGSAVPPYYLSMKMPDQSAQAFSLTTTFTPNGRDNLSAFMAVDSEAKHPGLRQDQNPEAADQYDRRRAQTGAERLQLPTGHRRIHQAAQGRRLRHRVRQPADGAARRGLLYVEPVYVRGGGLKYPLLRKVLVAYGNKTAFEDTLDEGLNKVFGAETSTTPPPDESTSPPTSSDPTVQAALSDAQKAFDAGQQALKKGDWEAYGQAQKDLQSALKRAEDAQAAADKSKTGGKNSDKSSPSASPSPSSSASASGSPSSASG